MDEYGMQAQGEQPWVPPNANNSDPWSCLNGCDKDSSCMAVFTTKTNNTWECWLIEGAIGIGFTASGIKVIPSQINAFLWSFTPASPDSISVSSHLGSSLAGS